MPACSSEAWRESQQALEELNQQLQRAVRAFPVERLLRELGSEYSAYTQFAGAPQHDLYHAGQVVLLKKALAAAERLRFNNEMHLTRSAVARRRGPRR